MDSLQSVLTKHGINLSIEWGVGFIKDGPLWLICNKKDLGGKPYYWASFGDFRSDLEEVWISTKGLTKAEEKEANRLIQENLAELQIQREAQWKVRAHELCDEWEKDSETGRTPYMDRKKIERLYGARVRPNPNGDPILIVPMWSIEGHIWNYQRIFATKFDNKRDKFFSEGGRVKGCFHVLSESDLGPVEELTLAETIYICEGYATACSVKASNLPDATAVVAAFSGTNLRHVAQAIREKFPEVKIVICADNDAHNPKNGGLEYGIQAAGSCNGEYVYPVFEGARYKEGKYTDFNDIHAGEGLDKVRDQILNPHKYRKQIDRVTEEVDKLGKIKKPTEQKLVTHILKYLDGNLIKQDEDLFQYKGGYWKECRQREEDELKRMIQHSTGNKFSNRDIENTFRLLQTYVDHPEGGHNMFQPTATAANFTNGTLYLEPGGALKWSPTHNRQDYLTHVLPFDCPDLESQLTPAPQFDAWLSRMWQGDDDRDTKVRFYYQLMGDCLCPAYPLINIFVGPPNCGKSTLVKMLMNLVTPQNISRVQLSDMHGFHMEDMVHKLVNFGTEMEIQRPIKDVNVKAITDRDAYSVNRKGLKIVQAYLPALHIFAANDVPASLDGASKAYDRRLIICKTEKLNLVNGESRYDFEKGLWETERQGILERAVRGLRELHAQGGQFTRPDSSAKYVEDMQLRSDSVRQFIEDAKNKEADGMGSSAVIEEGKWIKRTDLWEIFSHWQKTTSTHFSLIGKKEFYRRMESLDFRHSVYDGYPIFWGIGSIVRTGESVKPTSLQGGKVNVNSLM